MKHTSHPHGQPLFRGAILLGTLLSCFASCAGADDGSEGVGAVESAVSKCLGGKLGVSNYCSPTCKCDAGEGDCDTAADCNGGNVCVGKGAYFYGIPSNACAPAHCGNGLIDGAQGETQIDCGGPCGSLCPNACAGLPPNGAPRHCTSDCPCPPREGDCAGNSANCRAGSSCFVSQGAFFGMGNTRDVCLASSCANGLLDGDEQGIDCGPSCKPCGGGHVLSVRAGGSDPDHGFAVASDAGRSVIVGGRIGVQDGNVHLMKLDSSGALLWQHRFAGASGSASIDALGTDNARNVYATGTLSGTAPIVGTQLTSAGNGDAIVIKLSPAGALLWARRFGSVGSERGNAIAVRGNGEVIVTGTFTGTPTFGASALANAGAKDVFVLKLDAAGSHVFSKSFGGSGDEQAAGIAVDASGGLALAGAVESAVDFGTGPVAFVGTVDAFVARLTAAGSCTWARSWGSTAADKAFGVAVDSSGGPVVVGEFKRTADFGAGVVGTSGGTGAFVVALTSAGAYRFSHVLGGSRDDRAIAVVADGSGAAVLGDFQGSDASFGIGGTRASLGGRDIFLVRYGASGTPQWLSTFGSVGEDSSRALTLRDGLVTAAGDFKGSVNFGGSLLSSSGEFDMFAARYVF